MAEQVNVETGAGTHQRVALDLAKAIQNTASDVGSLTREGWLQLYHDCLQATFGRHRPKG
jgi:hypothetical protein